MTRLTKEQVKALSDELYAVDQDKRIEQLEAENKQLRNLVEDFVIHTSMGWEVDGLADLARPFLEAPKAQEKDND